MNNKITIIGGCGHIGIPLGLAFASKGCNVNLVDINPAIIDKINNCALPFIEEGAEDLLKAHIGRSIWATSEKKTVCDAESVVFVTGTPVDEHLNPRVSDVINVVNEYLPYMNENQLVILRSTIYPGTTRIIEKLLKEHFGKARLAFCPERIVQGKGLSEISKLPQIVSAISPDVEAEATELFKLISSKIIPLSVEEAELAKLMTNSWRYIEFAIANQFYMMVEQQGLDFYRIYNAIINDYPRAQHFSRPGLAAGPCLFKDTMQLAAFHDNNFFMGHSSMLVNEGLPGFLLKQLINKMQCTLINKKIAILGMTFKADNDDTRESLSFKLKKLLEQKMAKVLLSDPYLPDSVPMEQALAQADGIILGVPHCEYRSIKPDKPFVDCWGIWR